MNNYTYPAIFEPEDDGFNISFPDLPGCLTCGDNLENALYMATEALCGFLEWLKEDREPLPEPSHPAKLNPPEGGFVSLITALIYPKHEKELVKKTLTIPKWLDDEAKSRHVNFSQVLQKELKHIVAYRG